MLRTLADQSINCCVTSPPYWGLRDYGVRGQLGLEPTPEEYVLRMVEVFREVRRVLRVDGTLWLNLGDSYAGHNLPGWRPGNEEKNTGASNKNGVGYVPGLKPKDLIGIPWRVAFALQADGWYLRSDIIWHKPNPMPESVTDRPTKAHEYLFLLAKSGRYYYDADAIKEPAVVKPQCRFTPTGYGRKNVPGRSDNSSARGVWSVPAQDRDDRNRRSVWTIATKPYKGAHFATFPPKLIEPCILAGCPKGGTVLDPFAGAGTTLMVSQQHGREGIGIELSRPYIRLAKRRLAMAA